MKPHRPRTVSAVVIGVLALGLAGLLLSAQWGVAAEYGYGDGTELSMFALLPVLAGVVAVSLAGWGRRTGLALLVLTLFTVGGLPVAGAAGERAKEARSEQADARFTCNGSNAEILVPDAVDAAWQQVEVREDGVSLVLARDADIVSLAATTAGAPGCELDAVLAEGMVQGC